MIEHTPNLTTQSTWIRSSLRQPPRNRPTFENQDQNPKPYFSHSLHLEPQKRHAKAIKLFENETPEKNKEREEKSNSKEGLKPPPPQINNCRSYRSTGAEIPEKIQFGLHGSPPKLTALSF